MTIQNVEPVEIEQGIVDEAPNVLEYADDTNSDVRDFKALQAAFLENYNTGKPVIESYMTNKAKISQDAGLTEAATNKVAVDDNELVGVYDEVLNDSPEVFESTAPEVIKIRQAGAEKAKDPSKQFVDSVAAPNTTEETVTAAANNVKLYEMLSEVVGEIGFTDYLMDFSLSLLPFRDSINEGELLGGVVNNIDKIESAIFKFKAKPYEWQQEMFPTFMKEVIDTVGPIRGIELIKNFIDPETNDESLSDFSNWWKLPDVVDLATLGASSWIKMAKFKSSFNVPKMLKEVGNEQTAAEATVAAMVDKEAAKVMNVDEVTVAGNALPFDISIENGAHTAGISAPSLKLLKNTLDGVEEETKKLMSGEGFMRQGILHDSERSLAEESARASLKAAEHENIRVINKSDNTTTFGYQTRDESGNITDEVYTLDLTLNSVGMYDQSQLRMFSGYLDSPTVTFLGNARHDADLAQIIDGQTAKVFNSLVTMRSKALAPLGNLNRPKNRKKLTQVDNVLIAGDKYIDPETGLRGKVFDYNTLKGDYGLDESQVHAYYGINRVYNSLWAIRNQSKREEMIALGFKQVKIGSEDMSFGKKFEEAGDARLSMSRADVSEIYDVSSDRVIKDMSKDYLDKQYESGKKLVKVEDPYNIGAGRGKYNFLLVDDTSVTELPAQVLRRRQGYVPRVAKDGHWFVKEQARSLINGKMTDNIPVKTLRYFDNETDAITYTKQLIDEAVEGGMTEAQAKLKYVHKEDREQEIIATATGQFSHGSGGMYVGARSEDEILFGLNGDEGERLSAFEALNRNISNVSRLVPINQWRLGMEQRWINTASKLLGVEIKKFGEFPRNIESNRKGEFLNKMADQIRDWQGFPSKEEQVFNSVSQRIHEWALGKDSPKLQAVTGWIRSTDPISAARATAFHSLLGWGNLAQLWVQSQGMVVAASLNLGKNLTKTLRSTTGLTILGEGAADSSTRFKLAAKASGMEVDELKDLHAMWLRSGLQDSVLQTGDHAAAMKGHGITMSSISDAANKSLMFYRQGELLNRRMAFATAYDEFKQTSKFVSSAAVTSEDMRGMLIRTNNLLLNMSKANRAQFQKGIASVGTQFFQVSAKATETILGLNGNFTAAERGRMVAGQLAMYGAAGVPLLGLGMNFALEYGGVTQEDIDNNPELVKAWNDGFWGITTMMMMGVDVELSKRGSLARGVTEFVDRVMFDDTTMPEVLLGAFGTTQNRFLEEFTKSLKPFTPGAWDPSLLNVLKIPTMPFLESVSTWRNAEKAVFMETVNAIFDKKGNKNLERDFKIKESIMAAIGFQLTDEVQAYSLEERTRAYDEVNDKTATLIIQRMNHDAFLHSVGMLSDEAMEETGEFYNTVYNSIDDQSRRESIMRGVRKRIMSDDRKTRAIRRYVENLYTTTTAGLELIRDGITGTPVATVFPKEEKE